MSERTLQVHYRDSGDVDVQGYLKFTRIELQDISNAVKVVAARRHGSYKPSGTNERVIHCPVCGLTVAADGEPCVHYEAHEYIAVKEFAKRADDLYDHNIKIESELDKYFTALIGIQTMIERESNEELRKSIGIIVEEALKK